jgi:hypothetical protein
MKQKKSPPAFSLLIRFNLQWLLAIEAARSKIEDHNKARQKGGREPVEPPNNNHQKWTTVQSTAFS